MSRALRNSIGAALAALLLFATPASAARSLLSGHAVDAEGAPGGVIEDPCGIAVSSSHIYLSPYYAHAVEVFSSSGSYQSQIAAGSAPEGPCQLALAAGGALYANTWHEGVERLSPSRLGFDEAESTGVAVDSAGKVYVNDRTHIAVYEANGTEVGQIGEGRLTDSYGLAVYGARLYVADAATDTVKAFSTAAEPTDPPLFSFGGSQTPQGKFVSLTDAALASDPTNGHVLVLDDLQPGYEHPKAAIEEFGFSGEFLGQVTDELIDGGPSGMAVAESGLLYATSGNSEEGAVQTYSAYSEGAGSGALGAPAPPAPDAQASASPTAPTASPLAYSQPKSAATASSTQTIRRGKLKVGLSASLAPNRLPRTGSAPISFSLAAKISPTEGSVPPQLQRIAVAINRHGTIDPSGLPTCQPAQIQPATNSAALAACRDSLVGQGSFAARVLISSQAPFPSKGKIYAFNGTWHGKPAILAHVYGTKPVPTSNTIPFVISEAKGKKGTFGATLEASLPQVTSQWGYVTQISMRIGKTYRSHGKRRSYLSAGCPAPKGVSRALFKLSRAKLAFAGGKKVSSVLSETCRARP